jgi:hypothetical protein
VILRPGENLARTPILDRFDIPIDGLTELVTATYTGPGADPIGSLIISEIQYAAICAQRAVRRDSKSVRPNFDLAGWMLTWGTASPSQPGFNLVRMGSRQSW